MPKKVLTPEIKAYIADHYLKQSSRKIAEIFGIDRSVVQRYLKVNGLVVPAHIIEQFRVAPLIGRTSFTPEQDEFIAKHYLTMPIKTIAKHLNRSHCGVRIAMKRLKLVIPSSLAAERRKQHQFAKGRTPINKGKKQSEYMSPAAIAKSAVTRFKPGQLPHNCYNEVGKVTMRKDSKTGRDYQHICLAVGKWKMLHVHVWEQNNGPVPKGMVVRIKDGDTLNTELSNLELITRKEHRLRNSSHQLLKDKTVARYLVGRDGDTDDVIEAKELIQAKRNLIILNRKLKQHGER